MEKNLVIQYSITHNDLFFPLDYGTVHHEIFLLFCLCFSLHLDWALAKTITCLGQYDFNNFPCCVTIISQPMNTFRIYLCWFPEEHSAAPSPRHRKKLWAIALDCIHVLSASFALLYDVSPDLFRQTSSLSQGPQVKSHPVIFSSSFFWRVQTSLIKKKNLRLLNVGLFSP